MTELDLIQQLNDKVDDFIQYYNHTLSPMIYNMQSDIVWLKWILTTLTGLILTQCILLIWKELKDGKKEKEWGEAPRKSKSDRWE